MTSGQLIAVPIPKEYEMECNIIDDAIDKALNEANKLGINGKEITPFVLNYIAYVTGESSLKSSILFLISVQFTRFAKRKSKTIKLLN